MSNSIKEIEKRLEEFKEEFLKHASALAFRGKMCYAHAASLLLMYVRDELKQKNEVNNESNESTECPKKIY